MGDLFPDAPRRPRRVLMQVFDAGDCHGHHVHLYCPKCGHDAGWNNFDTKREAVSQPCPKCNEVDHG